MPIRESERGRYPKDWPAISLRIRERAGQRCEWPGCGAPNGIEIRRRRDDPAQWALASDVDVWARCDFSPPIRVVLTVAHLDHTPEHCADENLLALCQLHHLRLDAKHHARNARETRDRKRGQMRLL